MAPSTPPELHLGLPWDALARQAVGGLRARGADPGDRVVVVADNAPEVLALTWGALRAGIIPVPLNTALSDAQLTALAADADPRLVVTDEAGAGRLQRGAVPTWTLSAAAVASERPATGLFEVPVARAMHYTSGTTGRSKGVWSGLLGPDLGRQWAADERAANPTGPDDVHLVCSHLFHSGPHRYALNTLNHGGEVIVQPHFDAAATLQAIAAHRVTTAFMVPTHLARLLDHPDFAGTDLSSLRWVHHAGAACPEPLKRQAIEAFGPGVLHEFYGATEGQFTAAIGPQEWLAHPGSVGRARAGRTLMITDADDRPLGAGEIGRIWVTAPPFGRFSYWNRPQATAAAWRGDAFTVGDLGHLDPGGWLTLSGRRTDLIITGGVNVYPAEVEQVLLAHPGVREGVVFGRPHPDWGHQVTAAVVAKRGVDLDAQEVRAFLRERLAGFQTPKEVLVVEDLPRTASGKVIRQDLPNVIDLQAGLPKSS